jgi:ribosomal protein L21E
VKLGDLVKIKKEGLSLNAADMFLGHTGVIVGVRKDLYTEISVMINKKIARFLPGHLEVISEIR